MPLSLESHIKMRNLLVRVLRGDSTVTRDELEYLVFAIVDDARSGIVAQADLLHKHLEIRRIHTAANDF